MNSYLKTIPSIYIHMFMCANVCILCKYNVSYSKKSHSSFFITVFLNEGVTISFPQFNSRLKKML